ncbi:MAG: hypothetical protein HLUCCA01_11270 [Bacteroidetes bacterium HLUCCA01]|nr:MAG: hypothetical protein HLUCCA01_11270 [Bacteroidetes bacterium HLUCCA01]
MMIPRDISVADVSGRLQKPAGDGWTTTGSQEEPGRFASLLKSASGDGAADGSKGSAAETSSGSGTAASDTTGETGSATTDTSADSNPESQVQQASDSEAEDAKQNSEENPTNAGDTEETPADEIVLHNEIRSAGKPADGDADAGQNPEAAGERQALRAESGTAAGNAVNPDGTTVLAGDASVMQTEGEVSSSTNGGLANGVVADSQGQGKGTVSADGAGQVATDQAGTAAAEVSQSGDASTEKGIAAAAVSGDAANGSIPGAGSDAGAAAASGDTANGSIPGAGSDAGAAAASGDTANGSIPAAGSDAGAAAASGDTANGSIPGAGSDAGAAVDQAAADATSTVSAENRTDARTTASEPAGGTTAGTTATEGTASGSSQPSAGVPVDADGEPIGGVPPTGANGQAANAAEGPSTATGTIAPTVNGQAAEGTATPDGGKTAVTEGAAPGMERTPTGDLRTDAPAPAPEATPAAPTQVAQAAGAQLLRELQQQAQMNGAQTRHDLVSLQQQATELPEEELRALLKDMPAPGFQKPERHAQPGSERTPVESARAENAATSVTGASASGGGNDASLGSTPSPIQIANSVMMNMQGGPVDTKAWKEAFASAGMEILRSKESSADAMTRLGQMEVPHMALRRELLPALESMAKQVSNAAKAAPETWQKHNFTMDDGQRVDVMIRQVEGVMHLKLSASSPDLSRLLEEYAHEIEEHLKEALAIDINLQFGQGAFDSQSMARGYGDQRGKAPYAMGLADLRRQAAVPQNFQNASSVRFFGYNRMEWTA